MTNYRLGIEINSNVTPALEAIMRDIGGIGYAGRNQFMGMVAANAEVLTRRHILETAAPTRHKTAQRLGATPTGYLERRAERIESTYTGSTATVILGGEAEIFARAFGPVTVRARSAKNLTIPLIAEAYGRRAGEFSDLFPITSSRGNKLLVRRDGKLLKAYYLLKPQVVLPEDRGLLPSDEQYTQVVEMAAQDFIRQITASN
jgi:hypothetical protein